MKHLRSIYLHLPGVSAKKERELWRLGVDDWSQLTAYLPEQLELFGRRESKIRNAIVASEVAYKKSDITFFTSHLPPQYWVVVAASFPKHCLFLDIETTGLSQYYDTVTLVGWSYGSEYFGLVKPDNIDPLQEVINTRPMLVTFNGARFDLPFLSKHYAIDFSPSPHIDLVYTARRAGLKGGQKKIENQIGVNRNSAIRSVSGAEAVELWFDYKEGDLTALRKLVLYNHADIEGMKAIFEYVLPRLVMLPENMPAPAFPRTQLKTSEPRRGTVVTTVPQTSVKIKPYIGIVGPKINLDQLAIRTPAVYDLPIVGIDLTGSESRKSGWAYVRGSTVSTQLLSTDNEIIKRTLSCAPVVVSIDSPLSLPKGRETEFDDDPGRYTFGITRHAERMLKRRGINVYPALIPSMQKLTERGSRLAKLFRQQGVAVIESYPGAAQDILGIPRKGTSIGHLARGLDRYGFKLPNNPLSHDELDAITSALVGQFLVAGLWEPLGSVDEDYLIVPTTEPNGDWGNVEMVIGLSGRLASGKTTVGRWLETRGFSYVRFSEVLAAELERLGRAVDRAQLHRFGLEIHHRRDGQRWLQNSLAQRVSGKTRIVVDGLRYPEDHAFLYEVWAEKAFHIHLAADKHLRADRYVARENCQLNGFEIADDYEDEESINRLASLAKTTIHNNDSKPELYESFLAFTGEI